MDSTWLWVIPISGIFVFRIRHLSGSGCAWTRRRHTGDESGVGYNLSRARLRLFAANI